MSITNRLLFPADRSSYIYQGAFQPILTPPVTSVVIYEDEAATIPADVVDLNGNPLSGSTIQTDASGMLPEFYGPVGNVARVWAVIAGAAGSSATPLDAEFGAQVNVLPTIFTGTGGPSGLPTDTSVSLGSIYIDTSKLVFYGPYSAEGWPAGQPMSSVANPLVSVFGRTGTVTAQTGDYTAAQVGADTAGAASSAQAAAQSFATSAVATETGRAETAESTLTSSLAAEVSRAETAEALLAPKASPSLTGTPTAPTAGALTNTTQVATTAYTDAAVGVETARAEGVEATKAASSALTAETGRAEAAEALLAPLASPALTGTPTAPTATALTSTTQVATTSYADAAVGVERTRAQTAEGTNATAISTETARAETAEALLAPLASPTLTGTPTAPTKTPLTSNTDIATTAYADNAVGVETTRAETAEALKAPLSSPTLTGTPVAPTAAALTSNTQIATTAYADSAVSAEKTRAQGAETTNASAISTETTRAEAAEALAAQKANNLSDLQSATTARTNLGLGSAALISSTAGGDLSGTLPSPTVAKVNGVTVSGAPSTSGLVLTSTSTTAANWATPTGTGGSSGTPSGAASGDLGGSYPSPTVVATHLSAPLPVNQGGTGSATQNFVDLSTTQSVGGAKTFASPTFTGSPVAPTASALTNNTQVATTAYTDSAVGVETSRATTVEALKAPLASPALTGTPTAPTATALTNTTQVATTAFTTGAVATETSRAETAEALLAPMASPALTGTPTAPTKSALTNNTDIATTAYTDSAVSVETTRATTAEGLKLVKTSNLSDVASATTSLTNLNGVAKGALVLNVRDYGAVGNYQTFATGGMTASSAVFTDTTHGNFTSANVGQYITVVGAGAAGVDLSTTIASVQSTTSITLTASASTTVSGATYAFGTSDTTAINAAITAAATATAYTTGATVFIPPGAYVLGAATTPANNVRIIGAGIGNTTLYPFGTAAAVLLQASSGSPLTNFTMAHLTIDGARQAGAYNVSIKGIFVQYASHMTLEDLVVQNCIATGIGTDFLTSGTVIHNCRAIGNGRTNQGGGSGSGSNGIGIGVGQYTVEDWVVSDCYASGNGRYGIMMESQTGTTSYGMRITNCYSTANYNHGFGDAGGNGAVWTGCIAYANTDDGFSIDNGTVGATAQPGGNSLYVGCAAINNSRYGFSYQPSASNSTSVAGAGNHTYSGCKAYNNTSVGFNINSVASHAVSGMTYMGCEAYSNGASGLEVQQVSNDIKISNCKFNANGQTSSTSKYGIMFNASVTGLQIADCRAWDDGGTQKQAYAVYIASGVTITTGHIANNDFRGNLTGSLDQLGTLTSCYLDNNVGYAPASRSAGPRSALSIPGDTVANWLSNSPTLGLGEVGYETDTHQLKIGDGSTAYASLSYGAPTYLDQLAAQAVNAVAVTMDPMNAQGSPGITTGRPYFCLAHIAAYTSISAMDIQVAAVSSTAAITTTYLGIYDVATGNLLGQTADFSSSLPASQVSEILKVSLTSTIAAQNVGRSVYLVFLTTIGGTGTPTLTVFGGRQFGTNASAASPNGRLFTNSSGSTLTALPGTVPTLVQTSGYSMPYIGAWH